MSTIEEQIKKLELEKENLQKQANEKELNSWKDKVQSLKGKYFKAVQTLGYRDKVNHNAIVYIKILGNKVIDKINSADLAISSMRIACTPVGWTRKEGKLKYKIGINNIQIPKKKSSVDYEQQIKSGNFWDYDWRTVKRIEKGIPSFEYDSLLWFEPCTEKEYFEVERKLAILSKNFFEEMYMYVGKQGFNEETEEMIPEITEAMISQVDDLLKSGCNIKELKDSLLGKVAKWNYFNGNTLPELAQYSLNGDKGLFLDIVGGDDGSDYEPYTTRYYINNVNIHWETILYPIRTKLKSVLETAKQLENLKAVYDTSSWKCNYSTYSYDAVFENAKLNQNVLEKVNAIIKENLK